MRAARRRLGRRGRPRPRARPRGHVHGARGQPAHAERDRLRLAARAARWASPGDGVRRGRTLDGRCADALRPHARTASSPGRCSPTGRQLGALGARAAGRGGGPAAGEPSDLELADDGLGCAAARSTPFIAARRRRARGPSARCSAGLAAGSARRSSTPSAPASPTTSSPTPTWRTWSASTSARSRCCARSPRSTSPTRPCASRRSTASSELVVKPRSGYGGHGVVICAHAGRPRSSGAARAVRAAPAHFVAQELVALSDASDRRRRPAEPRHVDLRPFVFLRPRRRRPCAARRAHARRARGRLAGGQLQPERRGEGHVGAAMSINGLKPLIGVTTSEMRAPSARPDRPRPTRRSARWRSAWSTCARSSAPAALPVVLPPMGADGDRRAAGPPRRRLPLRRPGPRPGAYGAAPTRARPDRAGPRRVRARARARGRRARAADPRHLPRRPGAQRRARRHAAPAPPRGHRPARSTTARPRRAA